MTDFEGFFRRATSQDPYPYQSRLASYNMMPDVINIPTGSGKTEAAVLSVYLWRRVSHGNGMPRRLVYCLPRRSLVEQTVKRVRRWIQNLGLEGRIGVSQMMGGDRNWDVESRPEREYILVGTQDILLSGALNRQYGAGFKRWPMLFGLLNNDCLWIMDEVQIMENGLPTSRQLDAMRRQMGTFGPCHTIWMSATINERWLETPDSEAPQSVFSLTRDEKLGGGLGQRATACKTVRKADQTYDGLSARGLLEYHRKGTPTAIMVNTVRRAQSVYAEIKKAGVPCMLVHSRFRAADRRKINERISDVDKSCDVMIVSTQVLEAGVDLSVRTLVTELAPWSSMVQRFGRCNRGAEFNDADIVWADIPDENGIAPYAKDQMDASRKVLESMEGVSASPATLLGTDAGMLFDSVLRRKDVTELFDTAQDLSGGRTDASRFVRNMKRQMDVDVFWRDDTDKETKPHAGEVCSVPLSDAREFVKKHDGCMMFDYAADRWAPAKDIRPGQTIMLDCAAGGYSPETGWDPDFAGIVDVVAPPAQEPAERGGRRAVTLDAHTGHVVAETRRLAAGLDELGDELADILVEAARHHDIGKTHPVFQNTMVKGGCPDDGRMWAKSPEMSKGHARPGFRHEAASALAYVAHRPGESLAAYLIAAHHGRIRLSMRSIHPDDKHLLGLMESDRLPAYSGATVSVPETKLDLTYADLGRDCGRSWADMATRLLNQYGPFRLAYLEMVVRAADWSASRKEDDGSYGPPEAGPV